MRKRRSKRMARKWWAYLRHMPEDSRVSDKLIVYTGRIVNVYYSTAYYGVDCKPLCTKESLEYLTPNLRAHMEWVDREFD